MTPPKPAAEMDQLKFFVGKWKCEGKMFASPMTGPEHAVKGSAEDKLEQDGHWQTWTYEEKKSKEHMGSRPRGCGAGTRVTSASCGRVPTPSAAGTRPRRRACKGDKIVWTGEISGPMGKMPFHHTFTKKSDKEWTHAVGDQDAGRQVGPLGRGHLQEVTERG
jgi:hypothetical protein